MILGGAQLRQAQFAKARRRKYLGPMKDRTRPLRLPWTSRPRSPARLILPILSNLISVACNTWEQSAKSAKWLYQLGGRIGKHYYSEC